MVGFLVGDLIGRLKVNVQKRKKFMYFHNVNYICRILDLFYERGLVSNYRVLNKKYLKIYLLDNFYLLLRLRVVSRPGSRIYMNGKTLVKKYNFRSYYPVISTTKGIVISRNLLNFGNFLGGEVLFVIIGF